MGHVALASAVCTIKVIQGFLSLYLSLYPPPSISISLSPLQHNTRRQPRTHCRGRGVLDLVLDVPSRKARCAGRCHLAIWCCLMGSSTSSSEWVARSPKSWMSSSHFTMPSLCRSPSLLRKGFCCIETKHFFCHVCDLRRTGNISNGTRFQGGGEGR